MRIPKFGRALGYHFSSATAVVGAAGNEVYRLNLDQGRFLAPFVTESAGVEGVNAVDVNPAHGLLSFGLDGAGIVELWDPRSRRKAGALNVATSTVLASAWASIRSALPGVVGAEGKKSAAGSGLGVTALSSAQDGLNMAVGTSTGHVLLYDLRMSQSYATKDQGFSLPIKSLCWPGDRSSKSFYEGTRSGMETRREAEGTVLSADAKVVKVWKKENPGENVVTLTPPSSAADLNDVHQVPGTGLVLAAVEGTQMAAWYVPTLGPAPKWCNFIDTITDEMDADAPGGGTAGVNGKGVYEDFKFVDKAELERLGMDSLIGTTLLRPYMHGYFVALGLYEKARLVANPTAFADARERAIKAKMEKEAESRIRGAGAVKGKDLKLGENVKVNKDLAAKLEKQRSRKAKKVAEAQGGDGSAATLLEDDRFKELFTNPEFQVDTTTREFAMLNPNAAAKQAAVGEDGERRGKEPRKRTAAEEEEAEAAEGYQSSDFEGLDDDESSEEAEEEEFSKADSDDAGDLRGISARDRKLPKGYGRQAFAAAGRSNVERGGARLLDGDDDGDAFSAGGAKRKSFQERMKNRSTSDSRSAKSNSFWKSKDRDAEEAVDSKEISWTPSVPRDGGKRAAQERSVSEASDRNKRSKKGGEGGQNFGVGLSKGAGREEGMGVDALSMDDRFGRTSRRHTSRSASKNAMRR